MKHLITLSAILALVGCASAPKRVDPIPSPPEETASAPMSHSTSTEPQTFSGEGWSLQAPGSFEKDPRNKKLALVLKDSSAFRIVALDVEPFDGPVGEFAFMAYHAMKDAGYNIVAIKHITWAGTDGAYMEVVAKGVKMFSWMLITNGKAFALGCGGMQTDQDTTQPICQSIADSFKLTK
jgi:hypothetical protein